MGIEEIEQGNFGDATVAFNMKVAACDGNAYPVGEAEERDLKRMIESSCMHCNKVLGKYEIKVVPPQIVQEQDRYVSSGIVSRRVLCTSCYEKMTSSTRERIRSRYSEARRSLRAKLFKAFAGGVAGR
ncbi:MAG: hypothetical protein KGH61_03910 [Candidatus Micrarchaeota archaeon]|nr:hypothetical protein [Candidatus Micrarchaeota archaeon]MDE1848066.1 hypothetical protein [Candidatus Micrarchaeota archaeon]MDE1864616.1 hypothetical protein [Candidatus Micrarchaeota archaeon]